MRGLVLKDLYYLKGFARQYLLIFAFMAVWSVMVKNSSFVVTYLLILGNTLIISTVSMDEAVSFNKYALTMPVNRKMLVKAKYALMLMIDLGALLAGLLLGILVEVVPWQSKGASRGDYNGFEWMGTIILFALFMLISCTTLPAVFKVGVEKARNIYMLTMLALAVLAFGGVKLCQMAGIPLDGLNKLEEIPEAVLLKMFLIPLLMICAAGVMISYQVSLRFVRKKEW